MERMRQFFGELMAFATVFALGTAIAVYQVVRFGERSPFKPLLIPFIALTVLFGLVAIIQWYRTRECITWVEISLIGKYAVSIWIPDERSPNEIIKELEAKIKNEEEIFETPIRNIHFVWVYKSLGGKVGKSIWGKHLN